MIVPKKEESESDDNDDDDEEEEMNPVIFHSPNRISHLPNFSCRSTEAEGGGSYGGGHKVSLIGFFHVLPYPLLLINYV